MTVAAIAMVKDEADVIAGSVLHMSDEVDWLLVADNGSADGTRQILEELAEKLPLHVLDDPEPGYYQSQKMTLLAQKAAVMGATWIVPFDADELWVSHVDRLRVVLPELDAHVASAALFNHFPSAVDPDGIDPFRTIVWRQQEKAPLPKVAFRWERSAVVHQGNHGVTLERTDVRTVEALEIRHFPYRSAEQFVSKARNGAAAYRATDLPEHQGAHWRAYGDLLDRFGESALEDVFREHFWHLSPVDHGLIPDPAPYMRWQ